MHNGEIPQAQIDAAVLKILQAKATVGLNKAKLVDPEQLSSILGKPENVASGQKIADVFGLPRILRKLFRINQFRFRKSDQWLWLPGFSGLRHRFALVKFAVVALPEEWLQKQIPQAQIDAAVLKILQAKATVGFNKSQTG